MRIRRLDDQGDMRFGQNQSDYWHDQPEGVAQEVMTRLRLSTGEWFLDLAEGTDWATGVLGERTAATRDAVVRERVLGTPGVSAIERYFSAVDPNTREWTAAMTLTTVYGPVAVGVERLAGGLPEGAIPPSGSVSGRAATLGVIAGGGTAMTMRPANLTVGPRADVTDFTIVSVDAGVY